jgi:Na+-transporting NADH:ubiquinone oxidoreductase subunit C
MNTNGNTYTIIYSTIVVVLVAAILAFAAMALKPKQEANVKAEAIREMLTATKGYEMESLAKMGNSDILSAYSNNIKKALVVNAAGNVIDSLSISKHEIYTESDLKEQNNFIKSGKTSSLRLPVFIFSKDGKDITVIPCYGAGLWGPIWGYLAFDDDFRTFAGAYFDHESETPGLGAKIKDDPNFRAQFEGKSADFGVNKIFSIVKGGAPENQENAIDAITGATMTSKGLDAAINKWLAAYKPYFIKSQENARAMALAADTLNSCNSDNTIIAAAPTASAK